MTRLIDADALSEKLCETTIFIKDGEVFQRMINDAPTVDAVQIPIKLEKRYPQSRDEDITDAFMRGYLAGRSSADRPTGEWVVHPLASKIEEFADWYVCTACGIGCKRREHGLNNGIPWETVYNYPYCPNCGAKMEV